MGNISVGSKILPDNNGNGSKITLLVQRAPVPRGCFQQFLVAKPSVTLENFASRLDLCKRSWCNLVKIRKIENKLDMSNTSVGIFCAECCDRLFTVAPNVHRRLLGNDWKTATGTQLVIKRYGLLGRILLYILNIHGDDITTKQDLRALGRAHLRRNITESDSNQLVKCILETLISQLGAQAPAEVIAAWQYLLDFVLEQMYFDKIVFRSHFTPILAPEPVNPLDGQISETTNVGSTRLSLFSRIASKFMSGKSVAADVSSSQGSHAESRSSSRRDLRSISKSIKSLKFMISAMSANGRSRSGIAARDSFNAPHKPEHYQPIAENDRENMVSEVSPTKFSSKALENDKFAVGVLFSTTPRISMIGSDMGGSGLVYKFEEEKD